MNNKTQLFCIHENSFIHNRCGIVSNVYSKVRLIHLLVTVPIHSEYIIMSNEIKSEIIYYQFCIFVTIIRYQRVTIDQRHFNR